MKKSSTAGRYLAFDLGAESGRAILGTLTERGLLKTKQIHRFSNRPLDINGRLHWDVPRLYRNIIKSLIMCRVDHGGMPDSIGVDTWGIDFGLLDRHGQMIGLPHAYRDEYTQGMMDEFCKIMPAVKLYELTGIQMLPINTVFQLYSMVRSKDPRLEIAQDLLFMPDLLNYFLTGVKRSEFTVATTSQLFNPRRGTWENKVFAALGLKSELMQEIVKPGTIIAPLSGSFCRATQLEKCPVVAVASHDTASAVAAVPVRHAPYAYISSGTWSLVGIETPRPIIDETAFGYNITNEGGVDGRFRVLKNITGLWLLQSFRNAWLDFEELSYQALVGLARKEPAFTAVLDVDDPVFINPPSMSQAIVRYCKRTRQHAPHRAGQFARVILEGLALAYRQTIHELEHVSGQTVKEIHIVGGGAQNRLLCQFTADATGRLVLAGPVEATALGNLLVQAMAFKQIKSLTELRQIVADSSVIEQFEPKPESGWIEASQRLNRLKELRNGQTP